MTTLKDYHARAVGLPWCREEDYPSLLVVCEDSDGLPRTWKRFLEFSEEAERQFKADGYIVERAYIDPEAFPDWCRSNGVRANSNGRMRFAAVFTAQKHGRNQS